MDEFVRNLIYKKIRLGKLSVSVLDILLAVCITGVGLFLRESVMDYMPVTEIKLVVVAMDFFMAILGAAFIWGRTHSRNKAFLTYAIMVIWPVFAANSALWGKNGSFIGVLLILALLLYDRNMKAISLVSLAAGVAVAVLGFQAPAADDLLTLGWPNIFELTGKFMFVELYDKVSLLFIAGILLCMGYCMKKKSLKITKEALVPLLLFLAVFLPYFAPYMPVWAGYGADVLAVLFAVLVPKKFYVAFLHVIVSYSAYAYMLNGETKLPMVLYSVILFVLLADVGAYAYEQLTAEKKEEINGI
ncbi:MAG: hypothetical protein IJ036_03400 [Lachnospiraceae bacterium]|nr:hypothetical protein [Lachnospiraceae bacterium]